MAETLIPTCSFRWYIDHDGERILQQRFQTTGFQDKWIRLPEVDSYDEDVERAKPQALRRLPTPVRPSPAQKDRNDG